MSTNRWTWHILLQLLQCACDFTKHCHLTCNVLQC
jgi:hypothetical protein